jgi:hypothetical protein
LIWMNSAHPVRVPCPSMWCCWREDWITTLGQGKWWS